MAADLLIYAIVAAALVFWLRSILGTRNGDERQRDNPFNPREDSREQSNGNVIDMRGEPVDMPPVRSEPAPIRVTKTTLVSRVRIEQTAEAGLREIAARDHGFTLDRFMEGAEAAFEMIVVAFAKGDVNTLRGLLAPSVFNDFEAAIKDRDTRGETVETRIEAVRGMDVISATMTGNKAVVSVRFTAQEVCLIRNAAGAIISGEPDKTSTMIDIWTFGREIGANSPIWYLIETRDEQVEEHKTPLPESR